MMQLTRRKLFAGAAAAGAVLAGPRSIVSPAKAAAPVAGKQNAGWYRYKVGDFEVTVVTDGMNTNPLSDSYVVNAPKPDVNAALAADFLAKDKATHSYTPVVVNTGSKLVAIDTGLGLGMFDQSKGAVGQYHANLQAAGIDRNAVDVVIISHFHGDHINGLVGPENKPAFPNAEVMVPEIEWAFWADESNVSKLPDVAKSQMPPQACVRRTRQQSDKVSGGQGTRPRHYGDREPWPYARSHVSRCCIGQQQGSCAS